MNVARLLISGLLAGLVIIAFNALAQLALGGAREDAMSPGAGVVAAGLVMKLAIGTILVWLYVMARPRLGPGSRTAVMIALSVWLLAAIFFSDLPLGGMMPWGTYAMIEALQLLAFVSASVLGTRLYREA